jgi:hypothetical protein
MENRTDSNGYGPKSSDVERTNASQGGPTTSLGDPANRVAGSPASDDLQTTIASQTDQRKDEPGNNNIANENNVENEDRNANSSDIEEIESDGNNGFPEGK